MSEASSITVVEWALIGIVAVLILLPPKYDPAVRIKERQMRKARERELDARACAKERS